jgi:glycosyltransferase involved in cell wall biosynthesis
VTTTPILRRLRRYRAWRWCDRRRSRVEPVAAALALGLDREAAAEFRTHRIDAVFESARFFGWRLPYPAIAWFPDFQHRRLPQLFPAAARWRREAGFRMQIASGRIVMLSSESSHRDFRKFYPRAKNEVCVVRFATGPSPAFLNADPAEIVAQYQLPEKYFYLPNQFYTHKNHQVVVDALAIVAERGGEAVVCASGSTKDRRERGYFDEVMERVRSRGLENRKAFPSSGNDSAIACLRVAAGMRRSDKSDPDRKDGAQPLKRRNRLGCR